MGCLQDYRGAEVAQAIAASANTDRSMFPLASAKYIRHASACAAKASVMQVANRLGVHWLCGLARLVPVATSRVGRDAVELVGRCGGAAGGERGYCAVASRMRAGTRACRRLVFGTVAFRRFRGGDGCSEDSCGIV